MFSPPLETSFELQLLRIRRALASAAPTRLSVLPEPMPERPKPRRYVTRRVTAPGMDRAARIQVYKHRYYLKHRVALQAQRRRVS